MIYFETRYNDLQRLDIRQVTLDHENVLPIRQFGGDASIGSRFVTNKCDDSVIWVCGDLAEEPVLPNIDEKISNEAAEMTSVHVKQS